MKRIHDFLQEHRLHFFDILRVYLGLFLILKGLEFTGRMNEFLALVGQASGPYLMGGMAHYVLVANIVGGAFLILGFLTRWVALINLPNLIGALYILGTYQNNFGGGSDLPIAAMVTLMLVVFALAGSGPLSLDHYLEQYMIKHNQGVDTLWEKIFHHS